MKYIIRNHFGPFCAVCQSPLSDEEDAFDCCDVCGGDEQDWLQRWEDEENFVDIL